MSRSFKKHPSCGYVCYFSNKEDKRIANRKLRRNNKQIIQSNMSYTKEFYPDGPDMFDEFNNPLWYDWWEQWPIEEYIGHSDFKKLREVSDTWSFDSDGLPGTTAEYQLVWDNSYPYEGGNGQFHPKTTIAEARRKHNWQTLKHFIRK